MAKARKVEQLQIECVACGTINAVDRRTGEVIGYAAQNPRPISEPDPTPADEPAPADVPANEPDPAEDDDANYFLSDW